MKIKLMENYLKAFAGTQLVDSRFIERQNEFQGLTGAATAQLISKCVSFMARDLFYLEIGIFQGANLISVACENKDKICYGVDNFSEHFQESRTDKTEEEMVYQRIEKYKCDNIRIANSDFRVWISNNLEILNKKIGVYMYDGPHGLLDQIDGIEMVLPLLADHAVVFVDDLACENTQESIKILIEKYKKNIKPLLGTPNDCSKLGYQQGQAVLIYER